MFNLLRERYYWPGLHSDVVTHVRECHECTMAKRLTRSLSSPQRSEMGSYPFDNLTLDIVTMTFTHDKLYDKLLVFADSLSRWVEAVPFLGDPSAEQVMDAFLCHVACCYGWPRTIRSDGGSNLAGALNKKLLELTGVEFSQGAAYHSQSQGIAERVQGTLVEMARAANEGGSHWHDHLPFLLFSYHATPHRVTGLSPAMLMYGRSFRSPAQTDDLSGARVGLLGNTPAAIQEYAERQTRLLRSAWDTAGDLTAVAQEEYVADAYVKSNTKTGFAVDDAVCYRMYDRQSKLTSQWFGPCRVKEVLERGSYTLTDLPNKLKSTKFHVSQLRAYSATPPVDVLAQDEYIVDSIRDRRQHRGSTQYLVKWRGHSIAESTWEPRSELMRRCADDIDEYDAAAPLPLVARQARGRPTPAPPPPASTPRPLTSPEPPAPTRNPAPRDYVGAALPHAATLRKGRWVYARNDATPRGLRVRWIDASAFSLDAHATPHLARLRQVATDATPIATTALTQWCLDKDARHGREITPTPLPSPVAAVVTRGWTRLPPCDPPYDKATNARFCHHPFGARPARARGDFPSNHNEALACGTLACPCWLCQSVLHPQARAKMTDKGRTPRALYGPPASEPYWWYKPPTVARRLPSQAEEPMPTALTGTPLPPPRTNSGRIAQTA